MAEEVTSIKWHPGFCSAMELEFSQYRDLLDFSREFPLSKEPLRIDLLMIKKHYPQLKNQKIVTKIHQ